MSTTKILSLALIVLTGTATAQSGWHTPPHVRVVGNLDSGYLANGTAAARVVFSQAVRFEQTTWLQVRFGEVTNLPDGSFVRMTATADSGVQRHTGRTLAEWSSWSAAFNGNEVTIELVAGPNTRGNRVMFDEVIRGLVEVLPETICGPTDDRVQSTDPRQGRMWFGCTGWLAGQFGTTHSLMLSAGHCVTGGPFTLELNVPNSTSSGTVVRSAPNDQYPFTVLQSLNSGIGNDWSVSTVGTNSNTGLLPTQANGAQWYTLGTVPGSTTGQNMRITGYGTSSIGTLSQVQKTHVGPLWTIGGTSLCYQTDTTGGNSGSPVIHENTGNAIGIHTHGGCNSGPGSTCNSGTRTDRNDLAAAIAAAGKTPGTFRLFGAGCQGSGKIPATCASLNSSGGTSSQSTAPNEYAYAVDTASALTVNGFRVWTASNTGSSVTVSTALYADSAGLPAASPLATGTMTVGPTEGFYQSNFSSTIVGPGRFYIAVDHSASTTFLCSLSSGTAGAGFWRRPPGTGAWAASGIITNPSYQVLCAGGGGSGAVPVLSNVGLPEINNSFRVALSAARANTAATLFTGLSNTVWAGRRLPLSLTPFGAMGCDVLVDLLIDLPARTDANGDASILITLPNNTALIGGQAFHQWWVIDPPANSLGLAVSNGGASMIGG